MRNYCLVLCGLLIVSFTKAQELQFNWAHQYATNEMNSSGCWGLSVHAGKNNTVYHLNRITQQLPLLDVDPSDGVFEITTNGVLIQDYITATSLSGEFLWARELGSNDTYRFMLTDGGGNIYIVGEYGPGDMVVNENGFQYTLSCPVCTSQGSSITAGFAMKINELGELQWLRKVGSYGITITGASLHNDSLIVAGEYYSFQGMVNDFDPTSEILDFQVTEMTGESFVLCIDSEGNNVHALKLDMPGGFNPGHVAMDSQNRIWITGLAYGTVDFDISDGEFLMMEDMPDVINYDCVACYNWSGELFTAVKFVEEEDIGGGARDAPLLRFFEDRMVVINSGYHLLGDGNPLPDVVEEIPEECSYFYAFDEGGNLLWRTLFDVVTFTHFTVSPEGNLVVSGNYTLTQDIAPGNANATLGNAGARDMFVAWYNPINGDYIDSFKLGGTKTDRVSNIHFDQSGNLSLCGCFQNIVDFNAAAQQFALNSGGQTEYNAFLAHYSYDTNDLTDEIVNSDLQLYPNPTTGSISLWSSINGTGRLRIHDMNGKVVYERDNEQFNGTLRDFSWLSPGIYNLEIANETGCFNEYFIIQKR